MMLNNLGKYFTYRRFSIMETFTLFMQLVKSFAAVSKASCWSETCIAILLFE